MHGVYVNESLPGDERNVTDDGDDSALKRARSWWLVIVLRRLLGEERSDVRVETMEHRAA